MSERKPEQTGDNENKAGMGANKGDLQAGDIRWLTPPPGMAEVNGKLVPEDKGPAGATPRKLSKEQRRDLAGRLRAKLGLAASKRAS